jgi:hypothetical protein
MFVPKEVKIESTYRIAIEFSDKLTVPPHASA